MFCKIDRYLKHRKTLSWGKLIIIDFILSDIDNTKPSRKSGAVYDLSVSALFYSLYHFKVEEAEIWWFPLK